MICDYDALAQRSAFFNLARDVQQFATWIVVNLETHPAADHARALLESLEKRDANYSLWTDPARPGHVGVLPTLELN